MRVKHSYRLVLPEFALTELCLAHDAGAIAHSIPLKSTMYHYREFGYGESGGTNRFQYKHFPVIVSSSGAPWHEVNLYLIALVTQEWKLDMSTYHSIAGDLAAFRRFLDEENQSSDRPMAFDCFPQSKNLRPTYRFRAHLQNLVNCGELKPSTAKRRMRRIISLYRWCIEEKLVRPDYPPWIEKTIQVHYKDSKGLPTSKTCITTDLKIIAAESADPYSQTINDGGRLRPLPADEQIALVEVLIASANIEMRLIHLIALLTGARTQTILTMRIRDFSKDIPTSISEVRIPVGPGTLVDTKRNKKIILHMPAWLYRKLQLYIRSERAETRREKSVDQTETQYIFLTNRGTPYYESKVAAAASPHAKRHKKVGQTAREFIRAQTIPKVSQKLNRDFSYSLHDLRATYGMNKTDIQMERVQRGEITLHQARMIVMGLMGHDSPEQTDRYLNFRSYRAGILAAQEQHEAHLNVISGYSQGDKI